MMSEIEKTLEDALNYFQDLIDNPDKVIKIKPSFEQEYFKNMMKEKKENDLQTS